MKKETQKRKDYPIAFRLKKEVIEKLEQMAKELYPSAKKPNKSRVIVNLIMKNDLSYIEKLEKENRELKQKIEKIEKVFKK